MTSGHRPPDAGTLARSHARPLVWLVEQHERYGDVFAAHIGGARTVVCGGAAGTAAFFRAERRSMEVYNTPLVHDLFGRSVFNLPADEHRGARRLIQAGLTPTSLLGHAAAVADIAYQRVESWQPGVVDLYEAARRLTMDVCAQVIVGVAPGGQDDVDLVRAFETFVKGTEVRSATRYASTTYWRARRARAGLRHRFRESIEEAPDSPSSDVTSTIAAHGARHEMGLADLPDHLLALLIAARETTASLLTWLLVELALDGKLAESVRDDAERLVADPSVVFTADAAPVLRSVLLEAERLHSPNGLSMRLVTANVDVGGFHVERGCRAAYSPAANHLLADLYPQPHTFRPERFLDAATPPFDLLTFGRGAHRCPGQHLAEMVVLLVAAVACARFSLSLTAGRPTGARHLPVKAPTSAVPAKFVAREGR